MTGKDLKDWATKLPDECVVEYKKYGWEELDPRELRAVMNAPVPINELKED